MLQKEARVAKSVQPRATWRRGAGREEPEPEEGAIAGSMVERERRWVERVYMLLQREESLSGRREKRGVGVGSQEARP